MSTPALNLPAEWLDAIAEEVAAKLVTEAPAEPEPFMDSEQAARYLAYSGPNPRKWMSEFAARRGVSTYRDGRRLLFRRDDLDTALGVQPK